MNEIETKTNWKNFITLKLNEKCFNSLISIENIDRDNAILMMILICKMRRERIFNFKTSQIR